MLLLNQLGDVLWFSNISVESLYASCFRLISNNPIIVIGSALALETGIIFMSYPEYMLSVASQNKNTRQHTTTLQGRSLTLAGIAFAGFSLLISVEKEISASLTSVYRLLALSIGLLFISYQAKEYTGTRRFWRIFQEKTNSYGFMTLFLATTVVFLLAVGIFPWVLMISLSIALLVRFLTVRTQFVMYCKMRKSQRDLSRLESIYRFASSVYDLKMRPWISKIR